MRLMLLDKKVTPENFTSLPETLLDYHNSAGGTTQQFTMHRSYDDYSVEEAFNILLPDDIEHPSAFEQVRILYTATAFENKRNNTVRVDWSYCPPEPAGRRVALQIHHWGGDFG